MLIYWYSLFHRKRKRCHGDDVWEFTCWCSTSEGCGVHYYQLSAHVSKSVCFSLAQRCFTPSFKTFRKSSHSEIMHCRKCSVVVKASNFLQECLHPSLCSYWVSLSAKNRAQHTISHSETLPNSWLSSAGLCYCCGESSKSAIHLFCGLWFFVLSVCAV